MEQTDAGNQGQIKQAITYGNSSKEHQLQRRGTGATADPCRHRQRDCGEGADDGHPWCGEENQPSPPEKRKDAPEAQGESWRATCSTDDLRAFYRILQQLYRTKVHRPLFPIRFFEDLLATEHAYLLVTEDASGTITGGMFCVGYERKVLYEWFVCGDVMATWAGLDFAAENGFGCFDFMGAGVPGRPYSVRDFKMRFGGTLYEYGRFLYIANPFLYRLGEWVVKYWKALV